MYMYMYMWTWHVYNVHGYRHVVDNQQNPLFGKISKYMSLAQDFMYSNARGMWHLTGTCKVFGDGQIDTCCNVYVCMYLYIYMYMYL